ncbi:hypothetical protein [Phytomonospora endophytica]|uniref:Transposase-like protein n=1 Tax=Phytomonospora endophytica TaxID=714109 RepID=A0A841F9L0_9ACTN|nr:hypothetical protein [Phytomonospora endophytica]MBB6032936.1 transposase-like protein [Phytomonospora endophytica]GIG65162.1 hypothetical protein Pen01_14570 [Phytomonospora endophytica]
MAKEYTAELRGQAVRTFIETWTDYPSETQAIKAIAAAFGPAPETIRTWVKKHEAAVEREELLNDNDRLREAHRHATSALLAVAA